MNLLVAIVLLVVAFSVIGVDVADKTGAMQHIVLTPMESISAGVTYIGMVVQAVAGLFNPQTAMQSVEGSTSVMGMAVMSKAYADAGLAMFLQFMAMISVSLGIMNLLPIPPLDGGRFVIEIFQKVSRRVVGYKAMNYMSIAGMALFVGFFVIMLNQDIQRFVFGNW